MLNEIKSRTRPLKNVSPTLTKARSIALPSAPPTIKAKPICPHTLRLRLRMRKYKYNGVAATVMIKKAISAPIPVNKPKIQPSLYTAVKRIKSPITDTELPTRPANTPSNIKNFVSWSSPMHASITTA